MCAQAENNSTELSTCSRGIKPKQGEMTWQTEHLPAPAACHAALEANIICDEMLSAER